MKFTLNKGYYQIYCPRHPNALNHGMIYYHRYVMSKKIGRALKKGECVHHINGGKLDNRPENLEMLSDLEHQWKHKKKKESRPCNFCGKLTKNLKHCSFNCYHLSMRRVKRPPVDELKKLIEEKNFVQVGKMFGVTDNAIRKWLSKHKTK